MVVSSYFNHIQLNAFLGPGENLPICKQQKKELASTTK